MSRTLQLLILFSTLLVLYCQPGWAQESETVAAPEEGTEEAAETTNAPAGQEVEINEDNYRQFMELRDARQQRNTLPENAFKPKSGSQKLDALPEESQKHLRNQLREIIVQGDEWQPGDEGEVYPYVPSDAASTDQPLQKQEAEAWGELVDSYNKREAESYENAAEATAAMGNEGSQGGGAGNSEKPGGEQSGQGEGGENGQAAEENRSDQREAANGYSPNAPRDPNAKSTAGVSQNAMEFLKGQGNNESDSVAAAEAATGGDGQSDGEDGNQADSQGFAGEQSEEQKNSAEIAISESAPLNPADEDDVVSTQGTSQNALEYLTGTTVTVDNRGTGNTGQAPIESEGTLSIQDLLNAQGVGAAVGTTPSSNSSVDEPDPDKDSKDGDG
jgi:hypothetical protein